MLLPLDMLWPQAENSHRRTPGGINIFSAYNGGTYTAMKMGRSQVENIRFMNILKDKVMCSKIPNYRLEGV
jgi:hypothetical protein